jgi:hypothetical protein
LARLEKAKWVGFKARSTDINWKLADELSTIHQSYDIFQRHSAQPFGRVLDSRESALGQVLNSRLRG